MDAFKNALPPEGGAKPAQNSEKSPAPIPRGRLFLALTAAFCVLLVDTLIFHGPTAGLTLSVFAWYALLLFWLGPGFLLAPSSRVLFLFDLFLALTLALGSNWYFRFWNFLALLVLLPLHAMSAAGRLPWWRPAMLWERLRLLLRGLFGYLGAPFAVLAAGKKAGDSRRAFALAAGGCGALALVALILPILASADALFAAATEGLRTFIQVHFTAALWKLLWGLVLTPFLFGLLVSLRRPGPVSAPPSRSPAADGLAFILVLAALDSLYLLFLAVQSAGLFGGADYLAARGLSYADWARSGFFQMVGVTILNLAVLLSSLTFSRREGRAWKILRLLAALLVAESLILLASACWRMTLYVTAYGLSFKRLMTYWGMAMMALFLLAALRKTRRPDFSFCRAAFPLALAGWLVINCVPADYLVAKDQVDRYLSGESAAIDAEYLLYGLSYDTLSQLERLDGSLICHDWRSGGQRRLSSLIADRRAEAAAECSDWHTWSLSACLAAGRGDDMPSEAAEISRALSINTSGASVLASYDTHGGFHGDGTTCTILRFPDSALDKTLSLSPLWHPLPLDENLTAFAYGLSSETFSAGPYLTDGSGIPLLPQIKNGYYYFEDRHADSTDPRSTAALLSRASINATLAVYDADTRTLYYCELDT